MEHKLVQEGEVLWISRHPISLRQYTDGYTAEVLSNCKQDLYMTRLVQRASSDFTVTAQP